MAGGIPAPASAAGGAAGRFAAVRPTAVSLLNSIRHKPTLVNTFRSRIQLRVIRSHICTFGAHHPELSI